MLQGPQRSIEWIKKAAEREIKRTNDIKKKCLKSRQCQDVGELMNNQQPKKRARE